LDEEEQETLTKGSTWITWPDKPAQSHGIFSQDLWLPSPTGEPFCHDLGPSLDPFRQHGSNGKIEAQIGGRAINFATFAASNCSGRLHSRAEGRRSTAEPRVADAWARASSGCLRARGAGGELRLAARRHNRKILQDPPARIPAVRPPSLPRWQHRMHSRFEPSRVA